MLVVLLSGVSALDGTDSWLAFLRTMVLRAANNNPNFCAKYGKPTKIARWWLDLDYPLFPPPEFEQTG